MFRLFSFLSSLFRRDGLATVGKLFRYALSPKAWRWLLSGICHKRDLKAAGLVDEAWYRREYPDVAESGIDPVQDFLTLPHPLSRMPNPDFVPREYAAVNLDVKASGMIPGVHYARNGVRECRPVSTLENHESPFPDGAVELRREFPASPPVRRRTAVFASFSGDGRIPDTVLHYLRGLREVADNVVFVANNPVFPEEVAKLDGLVRLAVFRHHGCYDFGSYKAGWNEAKALGLLDPAVCDELVVCNDSCIGPVFPFPEVFAEMAARGKKTGTPADFWGMSVVRPYGGRRMIPSYFYVFGPAVLEGGELDLWFAKMEPCRNRGQVVLRCESVLTQYLLDRGYACDGLVPESFPDEHRATPIKFPLVTLRDYRDPLVKIKALKGDSFDDLDEVRSFIEKANPELAAVLPRFPRGGKRSGLDVPRAARLGHEESLRGTAGLLRDKAASGGSVDVLLLSLSGDEPWLRPLAAALRRFPRFSASAAAVPDIRIASKSGLLGRLRAARAKLAAALPEIGTEALFAGSDGEWPDVLPAPGIVFYPTASDCSDFRYNPHYALGRGVLPVLVFDRKSAAYPPEKEFARQNYAYFWKVFFTDHEAFDLYAKCSIRKGENAVLLDGGDPSADLVRMLRTEFLS